MLAHGTALLSSTGDEYQSLESDADYQQLSSQERIAYHRQQLKQRLGLVAQGKVFSSGVEQLLEDADLIVQSEAGTGSGVSAGGGKPKKVSSQNYPFLPKSKFRVFVQKPWTIRSQGF